MRGWTMALAALAGLYGAAGIALAAAGAHVRASPLVTTAADLLLIHAAAIVALCAVARADGGRAVRSAASLIALGVLLFSGELALHGLAGLQPWPLAAPTGGLLMIAGWLMAAVAMPLALRRRGENTASSDDAKSFL